MSLSNFSPPGKWQVVRRKGKQVLYEHPQFPTQISVLKLVGSVPATARPSARPSGDIVYVIRKHPSLETGKQHTVTTTDAEMVAEHLDQLMDSITRD